LDIFPPINPAVPDTAVPTVDSPPPIAAPDSAADLASENPSLA
jgi:hypothetical protein